MFAGFFFNERMFITVNKVLSVRSQMDKEEEDHRCSRIGLVLFWDIYMILIVSCFGLSLNDIFMLWWNVDYVIRITSAYCWSSSVIMASLCHL